MGKGKKMLMTGLLLSTILIVQPVHSVLAVTRSTQASLEIDKNQTTANEVKGLEQQSVPQSENHNQEENLSTDSELTTVNEVSEVINENVEKQVESTLIKGKWGTASTIFDTVTQVLTIENGQLSSTDISLGVDTLKVKQIIFGENVSATEDGSELFVEFEQLEQMTGQLLTQNVVTMSQMFKGLAKLTKLDVSKWETSSVEDMSEMFAGVNQLRELDLSDWNMTKVHTTKNMFTGTLSLAKLTLGKEVIFPNIDASSDNNQKNDEQLHQGRWTRINPTLPEVTYENGLDLLTKYDGQNPGIYVSNPPQKNLVKKNTPEKKVASQEGAYIPDGRYVTIKKANYTIWASFSWAEKSHSRNYLNQTLQARGRYEHKNGSTYLSLYNTSGAWIGYINASGTEKVNGPQGNYISDGRYVTLKGGEYKLWNNFNWQPRSNSNQYLNQTFQARGRYQHFNGGTYLSLYNNQGNWMGYININGTSIANGAQGVYINDGRYVTMTQNNYSLWSSFSWSKKAASSRYLNQTLQAKGRYEHFNGATYYSLYNNQDEWLGYINANAMRVADGRQGIYQHYGKKVTLIKRDYSMWSSFSWNERHKTSAFVNQSFIARGKYNHFNGGTYLSLYDSQGKWYGYLNQSAVSLDVEKMDRVQGLLNAKYHSPNYGIYVTSLADGSSASANGTKNFVAASTGKLPAMYYTQKMINEKKVDPHKKRLYTDEINQMNGYSYQRGGAGILQGKPLGSSYSLDTMLNWTAKYSDNQGANFLGYYGTNKYDTTMRREISAIIGRTWHSPFQITAKENAMLIRAMYYQGGQVMGYMQNTVYDNQRIPRDLPVKVAHKIGDVGSYRHDVAVIYTETPYVLSVMTQNYTSYDTISKLSNEIYEIMK